MLRPLTLRAAKGAPVADQRHGHDQLEDGADEGEDHGGDKRVGGCTAGGMEGGGVRSSSVRRACKSARRVLCSPSPDLLQKGEASNWWVWCLAPVSTTPASSRNMEFSRNQAAQKA